MFLPNAKCRVQLASGATTVYGQPKPGRWIVERCTVVRMQLSTVRTNARSNLSASQFNATEQQADAVILLSPKSKVQVGDIVEIEAIHLRVDSADVKRDVQGMADHIECACKIWKKS